jgi:hypothetical protein
MAKVTVYKFTKASTKTATTIVAPRMATCEAIKRFGGVALKDTAKEVDASEVDENGRYPKISS